MHKLKMALAATLLGLPIVASNASTVVDEPVTMEIGQTQQQGGCCWILLMGRWYCYSC